MKENCVRLLKKHPFYSALLAIALILSAVCAVAGNFLGMIGVAFWTLIVLCGYLCFRKSSLHTLTMDSIGKTQKRIVLLVLAVTMVLAVCPMGLSPMWNGEIPEHRTQYEAMAEALLAGRLDLQYEGYDPAALNQLENPYDFAQREASGIPYKWDHAFYGGKYYMYFGILPTLLLFLPYRVLTGASLTTYHATQIFVIFIILGIFKLLALLCRAFFKKLPFGIYLAFAAAASAITVWYHAVTPALYCTAISSAVMLAIWSLYFFINAVYVETRENRQIALAAVGALLGALVFACRPPIGLSNLAVIPILVVFLKQRKFTLKLLGKLCLAALPYVVVAGALMWYNNARFGSPFEFGQAYQLTVTDQTQYTSLFQSLSVSNLIRGTARHFFRPAMFTATFPYVSYGGLILNYPILLLSLCFFKKSVYAGLKQDRMRVTTLTLFLAVLIISAMDAAFSPVMLQRYHTDVSFLLVIGCFIVIGYLYTTMRSEKQAAFTSWLMLACLATSVYCLFLFFVPADFNYTAFFPETVGTLDRVFCFFKYLT